MFHSYFPYPNKYLVVDSYILYIFLAHYVLLLLLIVDLALPLWASQTYGSSSAGDAEKPLNRSEMSSIFTILLHAILLLAAVNIEYKNQPSLTMAYVQRHVLRGNCTPSFIRLRSFVSFGWRPRWSTCCYILTEAICQESWTPHTYMSGWQKMCSQ